MHEVVVKKHFFNMIKLQNQLNEIIDKNWLKNRRLLDFEIAILQEVSEFIDTYPWKWWKHMEEDPVNRKIELVDIYHFIMSYILLKIHQKNGLIGNDLCNAAFIYLYEAYNISLKVKDEKVLNEIMYFITNLKNDTYLAISTYFKVVKNVFDNDIAEFIKLYYAKNALNIIRQEYGYKEGTYQKIINNLEDNYHMIELVKEIKDFDSFEDFKDKLIEKLGLEQE